MLRTASLESEELIIRVNALVSVTVSKVGCVVEKRSIDIQISTNGE